MVRCESVAGRNSRCFEALGALGCLLWGGVFRANALSVNWLFLVVFGGGGIEVARRGSAQR